MPAGGSLNCGRARAVGKGGQAVSAGTGTASRAAHNLQKSQVLDAALPWAPHARTAAATHRHLLRRGHQALVRGAELAGERRLLGRHEAQRRAGPAQHLRAQQVVACGREGVVGGGAGVWGAATVETGTRKGRWWDVG